MPRKTKQTAIENKVVPIPIHHIVKQGDTIFSIARKYNKDPQKLKYLKDSLALGQQILIY